VLILLLSQTVPLGILNESESVGHYSSDKRVYEVVSLFVSLYYMSLGL